VAGGHDGAGGGDLMDEALQEDMFFPSKVNAVTASALPDCEECFGCNTQLQLMQVSVHPYHSSVNALWLYLCQLGMASLLWTMTGLAYPNFLNSFLLSLLVLEKSHIWAES
jgi:hypothetical protein